MQAYIYQADIYCADCAKTTKKNLALDTLTIGNQCLQDSESWPQGPYSNGGGGSDYPQHCGNCNMFLENSLTSDGEKELTILLSKPASNGIADIIHAQYKDYYSYLFE